MQNLSKFLSVLIFLLLAGMVTCAQINLKKPDVIQKMDKTSLEVVIDEINKTEILYRKPNDPKGPLYALPKKDVNKIIWNNGNIEEVNAVPVTAQKGVKTAKATDLLVKAAKPGLLFWDKKGLFAGLKAGGGIGMVTSPGETIFASGGKAAYNGGGMIGYRFTSLSIQIEALYTGLSYAIKPENSIPGVKSVNGRQTNLVVPFTATLYKCINKTRAGLTLGGFGSLQMGTGSIKVNYSEKPAVNTKNCTDCVDKLTYGVVGGLTATLIERPSHVIFIDARWYHSLVDNADYKNIAESGVKMNTGILSAGVLFNLSHD